MADPAAVFQPGGMGIGYSFQPSQYHPQTVNVPTDAGRLWAQVGETAMKAADMLQHSALNPSVRAQMQEAMQKANLGVWQMKYAMAHPKWGHAVVGETPTGPTLTAPATLPVSQATNWDLDQDQDGDGTEQKPTQQKPTQQAEPAKPAKPAESAKPESTKTPQQEMGQVSYPSNLYASSEPGIPAGYKRSGSDAAQQGTPASMTFLNPATGNIEPLQTQAPPQQAAQPTTPSPGMFAARVAAAPPPAPTTGPQMTLGATAQPPPGMELAGTEQAFPQRPPQPDQASLASWQAQNAHPVMSSNDALNWAKNYDTGAQRATYLQHGGPGGEPAYAFHMKGGGVNTVPISQIVKNGGGPFVAGQNTSAMLSTSDALSNPPPGQAPGMTLGATAQAPPGIELGQGQGGQPPAAPAQGGQVWNPLQPAPGPTAPPAPGDYNPEPYRQGVAQAVANPQNLVAQEGPQAGVRSTDTQTLAAPETAAARTQSESRPAAAGTPIPTPPEQVAELNADANVPKSKRVWQTDPTDVTKGTVRFTSIPSGKGDFYEQRFYKGTSGWQEGLFTPENVKRQEVLDTYGKASSNIPRGDNVLDYDQVKAMSMPEIDARIAKAVWWKNHPTGLAITDPNQTRLNMEANASKYIATLLDMQKWALQNNMDPKKYSENEILHAYEAATRDGIMSTEEANKAILGDMPKSPGDFFISGQPKGSGQYTDWWSLAQYAYHDMFAGFQHPTNAFAQAVGSKLKGLTSALEPLPEYQGRAITSKDWPAHHIGLVIPDWNIDLGVPVASDPSKIPEINSMVQGTPIPAAMANYERLKREVDQKYIDDVKNLAYAGVRVPDNHINNMVELSKEDGRIKDETNPMRDKKTGALINPYGPPPVSTSVSASPTPSPSPASLQTIDTTDSAAVDRFLKDHPQGGQVLNRDGKPRMIRPNPPRP